MTDPSAVFDAIAAILTEAGYLIVVEGPDGGTDYQLTEAGAQIARQLPISTEADQAALLEALLDTVGCLGDLRLRQPGAPSGTG